MYWQVKCSGETAWLDWAAGNGSLPTVWALQTLRWYVVFSFCQ